MAFDQSRLLQLQELLRLLIDAFGAADLQQSLLEADAGLGQAGLGNQTEAELFRGDPRRFTLFDTMTDFQKRQFLEVLASEERQFMKEIGRKPGDTIGGPHPLGGGGLDLDEEDRLFLGRKPGTTGREQQGPTLLDVILQFIPPA